MAIANDDIKLFYSGGITNSNPDLCLGGEMSTTFFLSDRLFDSITGSQTSSGYTDYRCVYFYNLNSTDTLYDAKVYISSEISGGANVVIGVEINNERQDIYITNATSVATGSFILQYYNYFSDSEIQFTVNHSQNITTWATNLQSSMRSISGLEEIAVTGSYIGSTAYFQITFGGPARYRYFEILQLVSSSQSFLDVNSSLTIQKIVDGGPKLKTAIEVNDDATSPNNVTFAPTSISYPIEIGDLKPLEFYPIWIKRTVVSNTSSMENDGFSLKMKGEIV